MDTAIQNPIKQTALHAVHELARRRELRRRLSQLDVLESESIHIMREVAAECKNPALLFSGGKDSIVMLRLAEKAFRPAAFRFRCCISTPSTIFRK